MENEKTQNLENKYAENSFYLELLNFRKLPNEWQSNCLERHLCSVLKTSICEKNPEQLLERVDILLSTIVYEEKYPNGIQFNSESKDKIVDTTLSLVQILNNQVIKSGDKETTENLLENDFSSVMQNLREIRTDENIDKSIKGKCFFAEGVLTFLGSQIVEGELDS